MRFVIQRVTNAKVTVEGEVKGKIDRGFMVLIGVSKTDTRAEADRLIKKMLGLRIFEDDNGKTNLSLTDVGGSLLLISQFTLYPDCRQGNRPNFIQAGKPDEAETIYEYFVSQCKKQVQVVEKGVFGADMKAELLNDGPFTVVLEDI